MVGRIGGRARAQLESTFEHHRNQKPEIRNPKSETPHKHHSLSPRRTRKLACIHASTNSSTTAACGPPRRGSSKDGWSLAVRAYARMRTRAQTESIYPLLIQQMTFVFHASSNTPWSFFLRRSVPMSCACMGFGVRVQRCTHSPTQTAAVPSCLCAQMCVGRRMGDDARHGSCRSHDACDRCVCCKHPYLLYVVLHRAVPYASRTCRMSL